MRSQLNARVVRWLHGERVTVQDFWRESSVWPRTALVVGSLAALVNVGTFFGLTAHGGWAWILSLHAIVIVLGIHLVLRKAYHLAFSKSWLSVPRRIAMFPRLLLALAAVSLAYMLVLGYRSNLSADGAPEFRDGRSVRIAHGNEVHNITAEDLHTTDVMQLRVVSAIWLFFAIGIALEGGGVEARLRARQPSARQIAT